MNTTQDFPDHRYRQVVELSLDSIKEISLDGHVRFVNAHGLARVAAEHARSLVGELWAVKRRLVSLHWPGKSSLIGAALRVAQACQLSSRMPNAESLHLPIHCLA